VLAAVTRSPGNVVIDDIPEPGPPRAGRVVVRPESVGICGSDLHHFSGHTSALSGARDFYPRIRGHEIAAVVAGLEPMVADPDASRRELATSIGAAGAVWGDPADIRAATRDWTDGDGPPLVVEASEPALTLATEVVSHAGRVVIVGMSSGTAPVRPGIFPEKEIDVVGSSTACPPDFAEAVRLVSQYRAGVGTLLTHQFPLEATAQAFEFATKREPGAVKVQIMVSETSGGAET
jgi:threonine dehydrogenase-like Zn-dependent dehydrogenase